MLTEVKLQDKRRACAEKRRYFRMEHPQSSAFMRVMGQRDAMPWVMPPVANRPAEIEKPWSRLGRKFLDAIGLKSNA